MRPLRAFRAAQLACLQLVGARLRIQGSGLGGLGGLGFRVENSGFRVRGLGGVGGLGLGV